ncbi:hypothetical protein [Paenibacillus kobensis]|uniref:hypothetical protein n=1 Tax=Paenibacillus kobensis TaxID=59841 RepID=UPI000FDA27D0|nr:hypothetical protein [Paenibacillus kobensis]
MYSRYHPYSARIICLRSLLDVISGLRADRDGALSRTCSYAFHVTVDSRPRLPFSPFGGSARLLREDA